MRDEWIVGSKTGNELLFESGLDRAAAFLLRLHRELEVAAQIHLSLLPGSVSHPKIDVDVRYQPMDQIGGDYCQIRFPDRETCYLTICDVCGHGFGAALLATRISSEVRHSMLYGLEPWHLIWSLREFYAEYVPDCGLFFSFFAIKIDLGRGEVTWCGAGHPPVILLRREGRVAELLESQNPLVGIQLDQQSNWVQQSAEMRPGDRLVLYTDGIIEAPDEESQPLGTQAFLRSCLSAMDLDVSSAGARILSEISRFDGGRPTDDRTLILAQLK